LVEGNELSIAEHPAEWAGLLELKITPVIEDAQAAESLSRVYGC